MEDSITLGIGRPAPNLAKIRGAEALALETLWVLPGIATDAQIHRLIETYRPESPKAYIDFGTTPIAPLLKDSQGRCLSLIPLPFLAQALRIDAPNFPSRQMSMAQAALQALQAGQEPNEYVMAAAWL